MGDPVSEAAHRASPGRDAGGTEINPRLSKWLFLLLTSPFLPLTNGL